MKLISVHSKITATWNLEHTILAAYGQSNWVGWQEKRPSLFVYLARWAETRFYISMRHTRNSTE